MNNYIKWEPINPLPKDLCFVGIKDDLGTLTVMLREIGDEENILEIKFKGVLAYRVVQEGGRLKTLYEFPDFRGFITSVNSSFLAWFNEESRGMFEDWELVHYAICNSDNIVDIISGPPVEVKWTS